jgi:hypothetical protein
MIYYREPMKQMGITHLTLCGKYDILKVKIREDLMNKAKTIHIEDDFEEIESKSVDQRHRLVLPLGPGASEIKRVKVYMNAQGEVLIRPVVEIPVSEMWLYRNKKALASVKRGLEQSDKGEVKELDIESLD